MARRPRFEETHSIDKDCGDPHLLVIRRISATRSPSGISEQSNDPLELRSRGIDVPEAVRDLLNQKDEEKKTD